MSIPYNDSTNKTGSIQECESILFGDDYGVISGSSKKLATFTRYHNNGLNRLSSIIADSDTRWQFHDSNFTTHPIGTTTLVDGQQDYGLADIHQEIRHVYVKNSDGKDVPLKPIDEYDLAKRGIAPTEFLKEDGMPQYYDKKGSSIFLYPAPSSSETTAVEGLTVAYVGTPSYFVSTDTTKTAGVPPIYQMYPATYASLQYAQNNSMKTKASDLEVRVKEMEAQIILHYSQRDRDDKQGLRTRKRSYV